MAESVAPENQTVTMGRMLFIVPAYNEQDNLSVVGR
jgi:hypothetical protein